MFHPRICRLSAVLLFLVSGLIPLTAKTLRPSKKLIAAGWDSPTAASFRQHLAQFETSAFNGTVIRPTRESGGGTSPAWDAFSREHWEYADFAAMLADLQAVSPVSCTSNFVLLNANPGNVDWFDDDGWKEIVEHWRMLARVAREGHLTGIVFDAEPYTPPFQQFAPASQSAHGAHDFQDYVEKARERGRQVMSAVATEYPGITILAYRVFGDLLPLLKSNRRLEAVLPDQQYGLYPAFIDGWLDVMPKTALLVDGNESAYSYNSRKEFAQGYSRLRAGAKAFVAPQNRAKLSVHFQVGQALYLDAYLTPPGSKWHIDSFGQTAVKRLGINLAYALRYSDQYVWVYGEKGHWWASDTQYPAWETKLPGIGEALRQAIRRTGQN